MKRQEWKETLQKLEAAMRQVAETKESGLRHGIKFAVVSELASQYFCEKKVELVRIYGKTETEATLLGKEAHEALLKDTVKVSREAFLQDVFSGRTILGRETPLVAIHSGMPVAGLPDAVLFFKKMPLLLFEYKFTRSNYPHRDHHVQARLYCYLLHLLGFDTSRLRYAIILASPDLKGDDVFRENSTKMIIKNIRKDKFEAYKKGSSIATAYLSNFYPREAIEDMEWALEYWQRKREAIPTRKPVKCRTCEFNSTCDASLARPSPT